jgi:hypothetical protein
MFFEALTGITFEEIAEMIKHNRHVVITPGLTNFVFGQVISIEEFHTAVSEYGDGSFLTVSGPELIVHYFREAVSKFSYQTY